MRDCSRISEARRWSLSLLAALALQALAACWIMQRLPGERVGPPARAPLQIKLLKPTMIEPGGLGGDTATPGKRRHTTPSPRGLTVYRRAPPFEAAPSGATRHGAAHPARAASLPALSGAARRTPASAAAGATAGLATNTDTGETADATRTARTAISRTTDTVDTVAGPDAASAAVSSDARLAAASSATMAGATSANASAGTGKDAANKDTAGESEGAGASAASATAPRTGVKFALPPSRSLRYDTFFNGARNQTGTIHWQTDGRRYRLAIAIPLPFVGVFSYASEGHVDAFGLAPDVYTEQHGRRSTVRSMFERGAHPRVPFTRTPKILALPEGAQDRFSMMMQLAALVRSDLDAYRPGVTREFYVVDNDSGELWPVETVGDEPL